LWTNADVAIIIDLNVT